MNRTKILQNASLHCSTFYHFYPCTYFRDYLISLLRTQSNWKLGNFTNSITRNCQFGLFLINFFYIIIPLYFSLYQRDGRGIEQRPDDDSVFEGRWKCGQKHGRGIKKKKLGVVEHQIWECGCLIKTNITLPPNELSTISRWQQ